MVTPILPLEAKDLVVRRKGRQLLGPVSLTLGPRGVSVVIGPNGAGKTTLLKALAGLERLAGGTLSRPGTASAARARQGFVFQTPVMLRRSVRENLAYPLRLVGVSRAERNAAVEDWGARIGLSQSLDRSALRLSGGERQKLSLARALIRDPDLLFLDEPCTNLDGAATREIEAMLRDAAGRGTRIVLATHDLGQARRLGDDALFLLRGRLHEAGALPALFDRPQTPALAAFLEGDIVE